jgi:hypothetical protein
MVGQASRPVSEPTQLESPDCRDQRRAIRLPHTGLDVDRIEIEPQVRYEALPG